MKHHYFLVLICLVSPLAATIINPEVADVETMSESSLAQLSSDIVSSLITPSPRDDVSGDLLTRKLKIRIKTKTLTTILGGLAQSCMGVSMALASKDKHAKQVGLCNVLGSIFDTAAQLAERTEQPQPQAFDTVASLSSVPQATTPPHNTLVESMTRLTTALLDDAESDDRVRRSPKLLAPILTLIKKIPTLQEKKLVMRIILTSKPYAKQLANEVCDMLQSYVHDRAGDIIQLLKEKLRAFITQSSEAADVATPPTPCAPPVTHTTTHASFTPVTMPSYQEYILNDLANRVLNDTVYILKHSLLSETLPLDRPHTVSRTEHQSLQDCVVDEGTRFIDMMRDMMSAEFKQFRRIS